MISPENKIFKLFGKTWYNRSGGEPLFVKHHTSLNEVKLQKLFEDLAPSDGFIKMYGHFTIPADEYIPMNAYLQINTDINQKHKNAVMKSTTKNSKKKEHIFIVQSFMNNMLRLSDIDHKTQESNTKLGKELLKHAVLNHLIPLTDFNATNVGFDVVKQNVIRYDLNLCDIKKDNDRLKKQQSKGFTTAQGWNSRLRKNMKDSVSKCDTQTYANKIMTKLRKQSNQGNKIAKRCLDYAEKTLLGKELNSTQVKWNKSINTLINKM